MAGLVHRPEMRPDVAWKQNRNCRSVVRTVPGNFLRLILYTYVYIHVRVYTYMYMYYSSSFPFFLSLLLSFFPRLQAQVCLIHTLERPREVSFQRNFTAQLKKRHTSTACKNLVLSLSLFPSLPPSSLPPSLPPSLMSAGLAQLIKVC